MSLLDALLLDPYAHNYSIAQRSDGLYGSGTASDPWDGSGSRFDARMVDIMTKVLAQQSGQTLKLGARVTLGPGTFTTKGYSDEDSAQNQSGWVPVPALKLVGAGVDVTTLKLVNSSTASAQYYAVGHGVGTAAPKASHCEISDMTLDCNSAANGTNMNCGAVRVFGDHVRIRRVKAINWGTKAGGPPKRCFVFGVITAVPNETPPPTTYSEAVNGGIEDCIAVTPASTAQAVTVLHAGGSENEALSVREGFGTGPFIRNCYVDAGVAAPSPTGNVRALSMGWCRGGVVENNQVFNVDVGGPYQDHGSTRDVVVRGNVYKNVARGPYWKLGQSVLLPTPDNVAVDTGSPGNKTVVVHSAAHRLSVGDVVRLAGYLPPDLNGLFVVRVYVDSDNFKIQRDAGFTGNATMYGTANKLLAAGKVWILDNYIELYPGVSPIGIHLDDSGLTPSDPDYLYSEVLIRGNQIRYVDGPIPTGTTDVAIQVSGAKKGSIRDNLIESANSTPVQRTRCATTVILDDNEDTSDFIRQAEEALMMNVMAR